MAANNNNNNFFDLSADSDSEDEAVRFYMEVNGPPTPMARARFCKFGRKKCLCNPCKHQLENMKIAAKEAKGGNPGVLFEKGTPLLVEIESHIRRPNNHFKKGNRWFGSCFDWAKMESATAAGPDVDNLAKFVLDALNGIVFHDDRQVAKLVIGKYRDNQHDCGGRTVVKVSKWADGGIY